MMDMPVYMGGRHGTVRAAVVKGRAPLLLSRPAMKALPAKMDFESDSIRLFGSVDVPLHVNEADQYAIKVSEFPMSTKLKANPEEQVPQKPVSVEVCALAKTEEPQDKSVTFNRHRHKVKDFWEVRPKDRLVIRHHRKPRVAKFTPAQSQCPVDVNALMPTRLTCASSHNDQDVDQVCDHWTEHKVAHELLKREPWTGKTIFQVQHDVNLDDFAFGESEVHLMQWSPKQHQSLLSQITEKSKERPSGVDHFQVVEVFSPPRFALECASLGVSCLSADLCTGWDFRKKEDRDRMRKIVQDTPPELLVCCPPCTWAGGWYHLNKLHLSPEDRRQKDFLTRLFINFCAQLIEIQLAHGKRVLFEHPRDSVAWSLLQKFDEKMFDVDLHMCRYGMKVPGGSLIRKPTRLKVSHADMKCLGKTCPGPDHPEHRKHCPIAGSHPKVGSISKFVGQYPVPFVKAVLRTVKTLDKTPVLEQTLSDVECLVASRAELMVEGDQNVGGMKDSLKKLHVNLGHPPNHQMVRVLKHGGASEQAIRLAREFDCDHCRSQAQPRHALPTQTQRVTEFNALVGMDIKYLSGWKTNQKVPALNLVDYGSSLQLMIPLFQRENSELIGKTFMERWVSWAGMPKEIVCDPAQPNIADSLTIPLELQGAAVKITAAGAPWQLGKVEVHGGWFNRVLDKIIAELCPVSQKEWMDCVNAAHCKNQLIQVYGMTPSQHVFGRNPHVPENLLDEPLEVVPATASLYEETLARQVATRQAARRAVIELQDDHSLRVALTSRSRPATSYAPGSYVAYWRTQKWSQGTLDNKSRWHGPATVLGQIGKNIVIIHKKQILRCAPEQVRPSTESELQLVETPGVELLGVKHLIEKGALDSRQFIDLVHEPHPGQHDQPEEPAARDSAMPEAQPPVPRSLGPLSVSDQNVQPEPSIEAPRIEDTQPQVETPVEDVESSELTTPTVEESEKRETSSYGPVRHRVAGKSGQTSLFRPARMRADDFQDLMREMVPKLIEGMAVDQPQLEGQHSSSSSSSSSKTKRVAEESLFPEERSKTSRTLSPDREHEQFFVQPETLATDEREVLSVSLASEMKHQFTDEGLTSEEKDELLKIMREADNHEVLIAQYMAKKASKELPCTGNSPPIQAKIDEAKVIEWGTIQGKHAGRLVLGPEAAQVRKQWSHRIMGSRYVITMKQEDDSAPRMKARWCLLGHLDPDLSAKAEIGDLQSPTLSQVGRNMLFQLISSFRWKLQLGDIKGAFLAAGQLPQRYKPLYARLPPGGIPGVPDDALIEVLGHVYGLNDSPSAWYKKLKQELIVAGFQRSRFDPCLFYLRDDQHKLVGIYGVHVDDCATAGTGPVYEKAVAHLKEKFEFRKWRLGNGDFCGATYEQDPKTMNISMSQEKFAQKIRPLHLSKARMTEKDSPLSEKEISCLRAINGSLNWLATQSRPDLATQVSFSQQSFPQPTVSDALAANQAVRRAKQHADQNITFCSIPPEKLAVMCHSDAAFANAKAGATQAGFLVSFVDRDINQGHECFWSPGFWKSGRLPRVVNSTLSAEAQSMSNAAGMCEWVSLVLAEALDGFVCPQTFWNNHKNRDVIIITDCKSLYDHLISQSSPTLDDRRTAIDIIILRDSIARLQACVRWIPTDRMLADALTKESADAFDLIRACIRSHRYQISPESRVLELRAQERDRRRTFAQKQREHPVELT